MKNRFAWKRNQKSGGVLVPAVLFAALVGLFLHGLSGVSRVSESEQLLAVEKAITRAAVQCYAIEGRYPARLSYLEEHYGLLLNHERYIIQYDIFASNIMPSVLVLPREFVVDEEETADEAWF